VLAEGALTAAAVRLSAIGVPRFTWPSVADGLFIHVVGAGAPAALFARAAIETTRRGVAYAAHHR
jgi:hypothetical protein